MELGIDIMSYSFKDVLHLEFPRMLPVRFFFSLNKFTNRLWEYYTEIKKRKVILKVKKTVKINTCQKIRTKVNLKVLIQKWLRTRLKEKTIQIILVAATIEALAESSSDEWCIRTNQSLISNNCYYFIYFHHPFIPSSRILKRLI